MLMLRRWPIALLVLTVGYSFVSQGNNAYSQGLMKPDAASQLGLHRAWTGAIRSPSGVQSIADIQLVVHQSDPHQYLEIIYTPAKSKSDSTDKGDQDVRVLQRIWVNEKNALGDPLGIAEAKRLASNEIRRLKRRRIVATTREFTVPRVYLYSISDFGALECRDAENGSLLWSTRVGDRNLNFRQLGVDDERVTVINGSNLILVDSKTGEVIAEEPLRNVPIFGAVNSGKYAMVATLRGPIESYDLTNFDRRPEYESASGRAVTPPIRSPVSSKVGWTTDKEYFYVMELGGNPNILFRLKTDGIVGGRPAAATGDRFFFGSDTGQVYAVRATRLGEVLWSMPFGEPFFSQPLLAGDSLFLASVYGNLHAIHAETGQSIWARPALGVKEVICVLGDHLYVIMTNENLAILNKTTGQRVRELDIQPARFVLNHQTDRMYLLDQRGLIQCLRPEGSELPTFTTDIKFSVAKTENTEKQKSESGKDPKASDPFGAGESDPFGGDDDAMENDDPFGGDEDPFGGDDDDPFGSDDDPFG